MSLSSRLRDKSIKFKLMAIYFIVNTTAMVIIFSIMLGYEYYNFHSRLVNNIGVQASIISRSVTQPLLQHDRQQADNILDVLSDSPAIVRAEVLLPDGDHFAVYQQGSDQDIAHQHLTGSTWFKLMRQYDIREHERLLGRLYIEASLYDLYFGLLLFSLVTMVAGGLALTGAFILSKRLNRNIAGPLLSLTTTMHRLAADKDYSIRIDNQSKDELGLLAEGLNNMLTHIEQREAELASELSQRKLAEKSLDQLAHYDNVTNLPNRHFFNQFLQDAIIEARASEQMLCVMFIDLDNFKIVNDTLGHQAGDMLLKEAGQRLQAVLQHNEIICRIGGDEFAIILKNVDDQQHAEDIARNAITSLRAPFILQNNEIFVGASIGISCFPLHASEMTSLLSNADAAMYHAKSLGKNNFQHYHTDMEGRIRRRLNMENSLRRAIQANELEIHYQPQIDVNSMRIIGFEALIRWNHPKMGHINPAEFIPLAEESGLIMPIGDWVMVTACYQAKKWQKMYGQEFRIAVNISARQLKDEVMVEKVLHSLLITELPPHTLDLELTESSLMDNSEASIDKMKQLRKAGIHISIDDFGTGFSSLSYLKRFPLNALKIDRSFINDIPYDEDDVAITNAIIALANTLKIDVIAEGVETLDQLTYLRANHCGQAQGNMFSPARSASDMEQYLNSLPKPFFLGDNFTPA